MPNTSTYNVCKGTHQRTQAKLTRKFPYKKWQQRKPGEINWNDIPQSNAEFIDIKTIDKNVEYRILVSTDAAFDNRCMGSSPALQLKVNSAPSVHPDKTQLSFCKGTPMAGLSATSDEPSAVIQWFDTLDIKATPLAKGKSFTPAKPGSYYVQAVNPAGCVSERKKIEVLEDNKPSLSINGSKLIEYCADEGYPKINLETDKSNTLKWFDENNQALNEQPLETGAYYAQAFTVKGCASDPIELKIIKKQAPVFSVTSKIDYYFYGDKPELSFILDPSTNSREMTEAKLKTPSGVNITLNTQEIEDLSSGNLPKELSGPLSKKDHGKYTVKLIANGCSAKRDFNLNVLPDVQSSLNKILKENMKGKDLLCPDDQPVQIGYRAPKLLGGDLLHYSWSSGETTPFIEIAPKKGGSDQEYQLTLTAGNNSNTGKVSVKSSALEPGEPVKSCVEDLLLPEPKGGKPGYEYSIDGVGFQSSPLFSGIREGNYEFFVRDKDQYVVSLPDMIV